MKKNILKKINPPSFDSFLRNLGRFFTYSRTEFFKKHLECVIFDVDYDCKKIILKKIFFYYFYVMVYYIEWIVNNYFKILRIKIKKKLIMQFSIILKKFCSILSKQF